MGALPLGFRRSRLSTANSSFESLDFNTTMEEMFLYDMFGEDYDEVSHFHCICNVLLPTALIIRVFFQ
jgi:hypothetical protein